jgi:hypothetical protein
MHNSDESHGETARFRQLAQSVGLLLLCLAGCSAPGPATPPLLTPTFRTQFAYALVGDEDPEIRAEQTPTPAQGLQPRSRVAEEANAAGTNEALALRPSQRAAWPVLWRIKRPEDIRRDRFDRPYYADYYQYALSEGPDLAAGARNAILHDLIGSIDESYRRYEMALRGDRDVKDVLVRTTALALTGTAAVIDAGSTGRVLSAIASGLIGTSAIVDEELFLNYSTQLIQMQMQLDRAIETGMTLGVSQYPLESALRDIVDYFHAGTVTNALHQLVVRKGSELRLAQDETLRIESQRALERSRDEEALAEQRINTLNAERRLREEAAREKGIGDGSSRRGTDPARPDPIPNPPPVDPGADPARPDRGAEPPPPSEDLANPRRGPS